MAEAEKPIHVVIAGAGVVGTCTAYFLSTQQQDSGGRPVKITLVDPTGSIAPAASGKAGGFLAQDWNDGSPTGALTRHSFQLHQELANALGADAIQYRRLTCRAVIVDGRIKQQKPSGKKLETVEWAQGVGTVGSRPLGDESTIAQVHPKLLCENLWRKAQENTRHDVGDDKSSRSVLLSGRVLGAVHKDDGSLKGARLEGGRVLECDKLLFSCGPWTGASEEAKDPIMLGVKYHSVVVPTRRVLSQCVFFSGHGDPEVYVRPDQTAYCTGFPEAARVVTEKPGEEAVLPEKVEDIVQSVQRATSSAPRSDESSDLEWSDDSTMKQQACYLPTTLDGIPIMGGVPELAGCFVAAGHGCWGILLGPATGHSMARTMLGNQVVVKDFERFSPNRYGNKIWKELYAGPSSGNVK